MQMPGSRAAGRGCFSQHPHTPPARSRYVPCGESALDTAACACAAPRETASAAASSEIQIPPPDPAATPPEKHPLDTEKESHRLHQDRASETDARRAAACKYKTALPTPQSARSE